MSKPKAKKPPSGEASEKRTTNGGQGDDKQVGGPSLSYFALGSLLGLAVGYVLFEKRPRACNNCGGGLTPITDTADVPAGSQAALNTALAGMAEQGIGAFGGALASKYVAVGTGQRRF
jgi:hypothetical protein